MTRTHFLPARAARLALASLALLLSADPLWAIDAPAAIAYVEGAVRLKRKGEDKPIKAELGMSVFYGDTVYTAAGKCQINMTTSGILRLSTNTTVYFDDTPKEKVTVMRMLKGKTWHNIQNLWNDEVFEVRPLNLAVGVADGDTPDRTSEPPPPNLDDQIARLRAEGNAKLDAIREELKSLEGEPVFIECPSCGAGGPHRWTQDGWECNCGATAASFGTYPTAHGRYNEVRDAYRRRIEALEAQRR
jgi:ribosomal protein L37AE/L43A